MKRGRLVIGFVVVAMLMSVVAEAQWVFVARKGLGVIRQMRSEHADVAAVILEANADSVYSKSLAAVQSNKNLQIIGKDDATKTLAFTDGERKVKMKVSALGDKVSEILVSANVIPGKGSSSSLVVENILAVCNEMKVECRPAKD
jgi:hypothetical protein